MSNYVWLYKDRIDLMIIEALQYKAYKLDTTKSSVDIDKIGNEYEITIYTSFNKSIYSVKLGYSPSLGIDGIKWLKAKQCGTGAIINVDIDIYRSKLEEKNTFNRIIDLIIFLISKDYEPDDYINNMKRTVIANVSKEDIVNVLVKYPLAVRELEMLYGPLVKKDLNFMEAYEILDQHQFDKNNYMECTETGTKYTLLKNKEGDKILYNINNEKCLPVQLPALFKKRFNVYINLK